MHKPKIPRQYNPPLIAVEVITTYVVNGVSTRYMAKYVVAARSVSSAVDCLELRENEEVVHARQMEHKLVLMK